MNLKRRYELLLEKLVYERKFSEKELISLYSGFIQGNGEPKDILRSLELFPSTLSTLSFLNKLQEYLKNPTEILEDVDPELLRGLGELVYRAFSDFIFKEKDSISE